MSDNPITDWIKALTSRGISLQAYGRTVGFAPKSAFNSVLTNDERQFFKERKADIAASIRAACKAAQHERTSQQRRPHPPHPHPIRIVPSVDVHPHAAPSSAVMRAG